MDRGDNTHVIELLLEERLSRGEAGEGEDGGGGQLHRWIKRQQQCVWKNEVDGLHIARIARVENGGSSAPGLDKSSSIILMENVSFSLFQKSRS